MDEITLHGHLVGMPSSRLKLNTPALILDLDALTHNITRMSQFCESRGLALRPHAKTHKCSEIAQLQLAAGAIGICCAKLGEAEALVEGGVSTSFLLTSPIVSEPAIERLLTLQQRNAQLSCVVDHPDNVAALARAFASVGRTIDVLIDIDPGFQRTGVASPESALELFRMIRKTSSLKFVGVQFYCGQQQHIASFMDRKLAIERKVNYAKDIVASLQLEGADIKIITGGGTGTHRIDGDLSFFTEIQAGSYLFMDAQYLDCDLSGAEEDYSYRTALFVDSRVISINFPDRITIDAGIKAFSTDGGLPRVAEGVYAGSNYVFLGDEHGGLLGLSNNPSALGEMVTLITPHCDPTVNLYSAFHVVRGKDVVALWPILGRGRSR